MSDILWPICRYKRLIGFLHGQNTTINSKISFNMIVFYTYYCALNSMWKVRNEKTCTVNYCEWATDRQTDSQKVSSNRQTKHTYYSIRMIKRTSQLYCAFVVWVFTCVHARCEIFLIDFKFLVVRRVSLMMKNGILNGF